MSGIPGGAGADAIRVNAAIGHSVVPNPCVSAVEYRLNISPEYFRLTNAEDRMRGAATNYSDLFGSAGAKMMLVNVREILSVDDGLGNDVIPVGGGTLGFRGGGADRATILSKLRWVLV